VPDLYEVLESYGARDIIAVEAPADTDLHGINAACLWTRSLADVVGLEHALGGKHNTLKVPKAVIRVGSGGAIEAGSVFDGEKATAAGVSATVGFGTATVSWGTSLGVYAAAAYFHNWGHVDWANATVSKLVPNGCEIKFENTDSGFANYPMPFALLLWWD